MFRIKHAPKPKFAAPFRGSRGGVHSSPQGVPRHPRRAILRRRCRRRTWRSCRGIYQGDGSRQLLGSGPRSSNPQVEWFWPPELRSIVGREVYRGQEGVEEATRDWFQAWEHYTLDAEDLVDAGDSVVVLQPWTRAHQAGWTPMWKSRGAEVWTFRDGKIIANAGIRRPRRSPQSRRAVGVGDVAGERGDRLATRRRSQATIDVDALIALTSPDVEWEDAVFGSGANPRLPGRGGAQSLVPDGNRTVGRALMPRLKRSPKLGTTGFFWGAS